MGNLKEWEAEAGRPPGYSCPDIDAMHKNVAYMRRQLKYLGDVNLANDFLGELSLIEERLEAVREVNVKLRAQAEFWHARCVEVYNEANGNGGSSDGGGRVEAGL